MTVGTLRLDMRTLPAEHLIEAARAFSQDAWSEIYDRYYPRIFNYCYYRTSNNAVAEDLASEVFLEALRGIGKYQYRGVPFLAWLYRIAHNVTADHLHAAKRKATVPLEDGHEAQAHDDNESSLAWHDVHQAILQLTEEQQRVIVLRFFDGLSHEEIAAATGRRPGAVRVLQHRALTALRRLIPADRGEPS